MFVQFHQGAARSKVYGPFETIHVKHGGLRGLEDIEFARLRYVDPDVWWEIIIPSFTSFTASHERVDIRFDEADRAHRWSGFTITEGPPS